MARSLPEHSCLRSLRRFCAGLLLISLGLAANAFATQLLQATFDAHKEAYRFGHEDAIPAMQVLGAPADADWRRWAMLYDGEVYRLYVFRRGSADTLYQFGFDPVRAAYVWGHRSIDTLRITGAPPGADPQDFSMLHDGSVFRLYMHDRDDPRVLHQFGFDPSRNVYAYGYQSTSRLQVVGFPADTDWHRWAMLHDGERYRIYAFAAGRDDRLYQGAFNSSTGRYEFGHASIPELPLRGVPANAVLTSMSMLHDGRTYRLYVQDW